MSCADGLELGKTWPRQFLLIMKEDPIQAVRLVMKTLPQKRMTATIGVTLILLFGGLLADRNVAFALSILALALFFLAGGKIVAAVLLLAFFPTVIPLVSEVFGDKRFTFGLLLLALFTVRLGWLYFLEFLRWRNVHLFGFFLFGRAS